MSVGKRLSLHESGSKKRAQATRQKCAKMAPNGTMVWSYKRSTSFYSVKMAHRLLTIVLLKPISVPHVPLNDTDAKDS